jgi:LPS-assembly lipoprotein
VTAQVDLPQQEFAKIRATRDAENRAARELAEIIRTDIAATLGR